MAHRKQRTTAFDVHPTYLLSSSQGYVCAELTPLFLLGFRSLPFVSSSQGDVSHTVAGRQ